MMQKLAEPARPAALRVAYLVLAHNNPRHFHTLVESLRSPGSMVFAHVDGKSDIAPFKRFPHPNLRFCDRRVKVYWGEYNTVEAILRLVDMALTAPVRYDYCVLLSGVDFPIRRVAEFEAFLAAHDGDEFISLVAMPNDEFGKPASRLEQYVIPAAMPLRPDVVRLRRALTRRGLLPAKRDYRAAFGGRQPFGGSMWWALSRDACHEVMAFVRRERRLVRFYRNTLLADEGLIHTIIGNSRFRRRARGSVTYTDWSARGPHPADIGDHHLAFLASGAAVAQDHFGNRPLFFARKFSDEAPALVERLRAMLGNSGPDVQAHAGRSTATTDAL